MPDYLRAHRPDGEVLRRRSFDRLMRWDSDLPRDLVEQLWRDPDSLIRAGQTLQEKPRCTVVRLDHVSGSFVFKRHIWGDVSRTLKKSLRRSSAEKNWTDGRDLHAAGIPTPRPRAYAERRFGPLSTGSYLLSDYVEGTSLYRFMRFQNPSSEVVQDLARQVASLWQQLDDLCVSHNDFKTENLLIDPDGRVWLIDLERMKRYRHLAKVRRKQFNDAADLLHPRNWRSNPEAAEVFRQQILKTPAALAATAAAANHPLNRPILSSNRDSQLVSVLIPCCNDAEVIANCVESVRDMADEILVADAGSTDSTLEIVRALGGCKVVQKQCADLLEFERWAHQHARHAWTLRLQPNERFNAELGRQVQDVLATEPDEDGFRITRRHFYWGQHVKFGGFQNDAPIRLYRKNSAHFEMHHGQVQIDIPSGKTGQIVSRMTYDVCWSVEQYLHELVRRANHSAIAAQQKGIHPKRRQVVIKSTWQFLRSYFLQSAWLDGWPGLHASWLSAFAIWLREARLWEMAHAESTNARIEERRAILKVFTPEIDSRDDVVSISLSASAAKDADSKVAIDRSNRAAA